MKRAYIQPQLFTTRVELSKIIAVSLPVDNTPIGNVDADVKEERTDERGRDPWRGVMDEHFSGEWD